jgi:hypothetical protein
MENLARPSGYDDALYRTLALLVRQLHARNLIDAPDLILEMRLLTDRLVEDGEDGQDCIDGILGIAQSFERELQGWNEARVVRGLYKDQPDR